MIPSAYINGVFTGASLIIAIGAQNAFVLAQAVRRNHAFPAAALCAFIDVVLISAGVLGLGALAANNPTLNACTSLGGALFLFLFGAHSLKAAWKPGELTAQDAAPNGLGAVLAATLAVSLLNPHVYLDTVILLGAVSTGFPGTGRYLFGAGAATASILWFFSLSAAGILLAPVLKRPATWRAVNLLVCAMVWWVAGGLAMPYVKTLLFR